jgi:hypothetical protein
MHPVDFLAVVGTVLGFYYAYLGIEVGGHLVDEERRKSPSDRILRSGLLWSLGEGERYSDEGNKICRRGNLVALVAAACWIAWGVLK